MRLPLSFLILCSFYTTCSKAHFGSSSYCCRTTRLASTTTTIPRHYYNHRPSNNNQRRSSSSRRGLLAYYYGTSSNSDIYGARLAARKEKKAKAVAPPPGPLEEFSFDDLGPIGKTIAGTVQIVTTTLLEYVTGFTAGYVFGLVRFSPGLFRKVDPEIRQAFFREVQGRMGRMNGNSVRWAKQWGGISAAFGGFRVAVKVLRGGKEDEWSSVFSSAAAGAYFSRAEGPQAMIKSALLYGGFVYVLSGPLAGNKDKLLQIKEEPVL